MMYIVFIKKRSEIVYNHNKMTIFFSLCKLSKSAIAALCTFTGCSAGSKSGHPAGEGSRVARFSGREKAGEA